MSKFPWTNSALWREVKEKGGIVIGYEGDYVVAEKIYLGVIKSVCDEDIPAGIFFITDDGGLPQDVVKKICSTYENVGDCIWLCFRT